MRTWCTVSCLLPKPRRVVIVKPYKRREPYKRGEERRELSFQKKSANPGKKLKESVRQTSPTGQRRVLKPDDARAMGYHAYIGIYLLVYLESIEIGGKLENLTWYLSTEFLYCLGGIMGRLGMPDMWTTGQTSEWYEMDRERCSVKDARTLLLLLFSENE